MVLESESFESTLQRRNQVNLCTGVAVSPEWYTVLESLFRITEAYKDALQEPKKKEHSTGGNAPKAKDLMLQGK